MKFTKIEYEFDNQKEYEDLLNELFIGLEHHKKKHLDFNFNIVQGDKKLEIKTLRLDESVN